MGLNEDPVQELLRNGALTKCPQCGEGLSGEKGWRFIGYKTEGFDILHRSEKHELKMRLTIMGCNRCKYVMYFEQ
jgi:hypothetical protein